MGSRKLGKVYNQIQNEWKDFSGSVGIEISKSFCKQRLRFYQWTMERKNKSADDPAIQGAQAPLVNCLHIMQELRKMEKDQMEIYWKNTPTARQ